MLGVSIILPTICMKMSQFENRYNSVKFFPNYKFTRYSGCWEVKNQESDKDKNTAMNTDLQITLILGMNAKSYKMNRNKKIRPLNYNEDLLYELLKKNTYVFALPSVFVH